MSRLLFFPNYHCISFSDSNAHFLPLDISKLSLIKIQFESVANIIGQTGRLIIPYYMNFNAIEKNDTLDIETCGICSDISLFPMSFLADI